MYRVQTWLTVLCSLAFVVLVVPTQTFGQVDDLLDESLDAVEATEESPLLSEPSSPPEFFDAIVLTSDLALPKLSRRYLEQLMAANPTDADLLEMREKHGPAAFLKLANIPELQPLSVDLMRRMNAAFQVQATDPAHIDALISQLFESPTQREEAVIQLRGIGPAVVPPLVTRLGASSDAEEQQIIRYTLTRLGRQAVPALVALLNSPDVRLKSTAIDALGWSGLEEVVPHLWYPAFGSDQSSGIKMAARSALVRLLNVTPSQVATAEYGAAKRLEQAALEHLRQEYDWHADEDGRVTLWSWDPAGSTVVPQKTTPYGASLFVGQQFAHDAMGLAPESQEIQALFLALALGWEAYRTGWNNVLPTGPGTAHNLALVSGADAIGAALDLALKSPNPGSALGALRAISQVATQHDVFGSGEADSSITAALNYPDQRVQFAAASAIVELAPQQPFRRSHRVIQVLQRAINDDGVSHAVVVDADTERAGEIAGVVDQLGYDTVIARTGRAGFQQAANRGDIELIVLQANTIQWDLSQTIANIRADARTASIPIAVYGNETNQAKIERLATRERLVRFVTETASSDDFGYQLKPLLSRVKTPALDPSQRVQRAENATYLLARIADSSLREVFDLTVAQNALVLASTNPQLSANALFTLSKIPTREAQTLLYDLAFTETLDPAIREIAASHLAFHIQNYSLLLSSEQVLGMKTGWQNTTNPGLRTAMATILGSLKPDSKLVGQVLRSYPRVVTPAPPQ